MRARLPPPDAGGLPGGGRRSLVVGLVCVIGFLGFYTEALSMTRHLRNRVGGLAEFVATARADQNFDGAPAEEEAEGSVGAAKGEDDDAPRAPVELDKNLWQPVAPSPKAAHVCVHRSDEGCGGFGAAAKAAPSRAAASPEPAGLQAPSPPAPPARGVGAGSDGSAIQPAPPSGSASSAPSSPSGSASSAPSASSSAAASPSASASDTPAAAPALEEGAAPTRGATETPSGLYSARPDPGEQAATRALQALLDDPLADCTADWRATMSAYGDFHRAGVAALRRRDAVVPRVVVFSCYETPDDSVLVSEDCGGFADRLVGMTHVFLVALLNRFIFFAQWQEAQHVFSSPFMPDYIYNQSLVEYGERTKVYESFIGCPERTGQPCPVGHPNITSMLSGDVNYVRVNRGGVRWGGEAALQALYSRGLDAPHVGGCIYRALVMPQAATLARFLRHALFILNPAHQVIGVHERLGDRVMHQLDAAAVDFESEHWQCVQTHATRMAAAGGLPVRLFFVSDSLEYKQRALAHFGADTLFITEVSPYHINKQQLHWDGLIYRPSPFPGPRERLLTTYGEWFLLSLSDLIIMPGFSGYSRTAYAFSQRNASAVNTANFEARYLYGCHRFIRQEEMADLGAGY